MLEIEVDFVYFRNYARYRAQTNLQPIFYSAAGFTVVKCRIHRTYSFLYRKHLLSSDWFHTAKTRTEQYGQIERTNERWKIEYLFVSTLMRSPLLQLFCTIIAGVTVYWTYVRSANRCDRRDDEENVFEIKYWHYYYESTPFAYNAQRLDFSQRLSISVPPRLASPRLVSIKNNNNNNKSRADTHHNDSV